MSRGGFKITRCDFSERDSTDRVDWIDSFARKVENLSKDPQTAVEAARIRNQQSIVDQISSIVSKNPTFSTVEGVVQDMQERIGLKEYLRRISSEEESDGKQALAEDAHELPDTFDNLPNDVKEDIKTYIRNKVETHHGNIHVPAVVEDVMQTFRTKGIQPQDVNDTRFEKYISDEIVRAKKSKPSFDDRNLNIGRGVGVDSNDVDSANFDMFDSLNPAKTNS